MITLGTATTEGATRLLLLGSGELGKEVAIEAQRLGIEVVACDRYADAPAMQVAHRSYVFEMLDGERLREVVERERPNLIVPEIEAIATETLVALESEGFNVVPTARAARLTMNREGIRRLVSEQLGLKTSPYRFASDQGELRAAVESLGLPVIIKPLMSSSGRGQSMVRTEEQLAAAWQLAQQEARGGAGRVIVEGVVAFDYEITLLTVRHSGGTTFCEPIGHRQVDGDYHESWQPQAMTALAHQRATEMAAKVTEALGGFGIFGVEFFCKGDEVWFSEVSPRPHDTGMVTLISQDLSEFALHVRAILGFQIPAITQYGAAASHVILGHGHSHNPGFQVGQEALAHPDTSLRLFGKPEINGERRLGVALARASTSEEARAKAHRVATSFTVVSATDPPS